MGPLDRLLFVGGSIVLWMLNARADFHEEAFSPANDRFSNAAAISGTSVVLTGSNVGASREPSEPWHAGIYGESSVWWNWTAPNSGAVLLDRRAGGPMVAVYTGSALGNLVSVGANIDILGRTELKAQFSFFAVAGQQYRIALDSTNTPGSFDLRLSYTDPTPPQILQPLVSQAVTLGTPATLLTRASGTQPISYRWFDNGVELPNEGRFYLGFSGTPSDLGIHHVQVIASNQVGTAASDAVVTVYDPRSAPSVTVTTIAGINEPGYVDSTNHLAVRFNQPNGISYWADGVIAVSDTLNHVVRFVDPQGRTVTYAGAGQGYLNGPATLARFNFPLGLFVDRSLDLLVADTENDIIRRISRSGIHDVSTLAGNGARGYGDGVANQAQFDFPNDLVSDGSGNVFVTEFQNHTVRKITPDGFVSTLAGSGTAGFQNGTGKAASFDSPAGLAIDRQGNLYLTEWGNHSVRKITPQGVVSTFTGGNGAGFTDGGPGSAKLNRPDGITMDPFGNLFLVENGNHAIRKIDANGAVTTIAGLGAAGFKDGNASEAMFDGPGGIMWHPNGSLYVADTENHAIRRVSFIESTNIELTEVQMTLNPAITVWGPQGASYQIQAADQLGSSAAGEWRALATITVTNGNPQVWYDPQPASQKKRLYRAVRAFP